MPIWLPAWKTPVNSASSSSRKQTKGCLLAVLPSKVTSLHPCPWLSATLPCSPGLSTALWPWAVKGSGSRFGWSWDVHSRDPTHTRELEQGAPRKRQDQFCWCTCPVVKEASFFTSSRILRPPFIYFVIYYILQLHLSLSFLLTCLCLLSKTFFVG